MLNHALKHTVVNDTKQSYNLIGVEVDLRRVTACIKVNELGTLDKFVEERTTEMKRISDRLEAHRKALRVGGFVLCENCLKLLPSKEAKKCSRCKRVCYCSIGCQKKDWVEHKVCCYEKQT